MRYYLAVLIFIFNIAYAQTSTQVKFEETVSNILKKYGDNIQIGLYAHSIPEKRVLQMNPDIIYRSASTIKAIILLEFFTQYEKTLDQVPPGVTEILANRKHSAWKAYSKKQHNYIRKKLRDKTVRELGNFMINRYQDNVNLGVAYNAATSVIIALLGGPEEVTKKIQKRLNTTDITVGRYMNTAKYDVNKKNTLSARTLAKLYDGLARADLPNISPKVIRACHDVLRYEKWGHNFEYRKGGDLITIHNNKVPLVRARGGWFESDETKFIYALLLEQKKAEHASECEIRLAYLKQKEALEKIIFELRQYFNS